MLGRRPLAPIASLALLVLAVVAPGAALGADEGFKLALAPVGQSGPYFDLTMEPGDSLDLEVDVANDGDAGVATRTYASDAFTITNGGYGGRLRNERQTGTTTWVEYPTNVLFLDSGQRVRRSLTVTVPHDTGPGEYITSLVLENDVAVSGNGDVAFDQFVRQAIALVIRVPGNRSPALELGAATYKVVGSRSIVSVAVDNTGNVRLKPTVDFVLRDAADTVVSRKAFQMDTFFAHTDTHVEVTLEAPLLPGSYWVQLSLEDVASGVVAANGAIPFVVESAATGATVDGAGPGLTEVLQNPRTGMFGLPAWVMILFAGLIGGGIVSGSFVAVVRRRRQGGARVDSSSP
jgi:hypothetical protein